MSFVVLSNERNSIFIAVSFSAVHKFQGHNGYICGGYSEVPWKYDNGSGKYSQSSRYLMPDLIRLGRRPSAHGFSFFSCFLFNLVNYEGIPPTRFDVVRPKYATLSHAR